MTESEAADVIADVWASVLGLPDVDRATDFFDPGADSILVARAVRQPRTRWRVLRMVDAFACPTVDALARFVATSGSPQ